MSDKRTDWALLLLRLTFGGLMIINHGWKKLLKFTEEGPIKFGDPLGTGPEIALSLAVFSEVLCAALLIIGLFTRWATVPLIITMLVAMFVVHGDDPFAAKEKAILFLVPFIALLLTGPGYFSVDSWRIGKQL